MVSSATMNRPQRWDRPFDPDMSDSDVERILAMPLMSSIDADQFPKNQSLREIIRNDSRILRFQRGDFIVRQGDYGNSVFLVLKGTARVAIDEPPGLHKSRRSGKGSFFKSLGQLWRNAKVPERRNVSSYEGKDDVSLRGSSTKARTFLKDVDGYIKKYETIALTDGNTFGEIAAISRTPRTATVFAETDVELIEMRWQGVRDIRKRDAGIRDRLNQFYRAHRLETQLHSSAYLAHLDEESINKIVESTLFEMHGAHDWFSGFKKIEARNTGDVMAAEPVIVEQGAYLDGLLLICSGHARISERLDSGERTVGYLRPDDIFGLEEIVANQRDGEDLFARRSLRAIGYVDVLRIPTALVEEYILPSLPAHLMPKTDNKTKKAAAIVGDQGVGIEQPLFDFLVDQRFINGTATMMINTSRCTNCDDCVRACAAAHDNNPRFIRHGPIHGNLQVANACMHCADPVCLIECPTGAIGRQSEDGRVMIDDLLCIGCGTCANSCPYNNIQLVEIRNQEGDFITDKNTNQPIVKATKCDLCFGQLGGPACQRACPHDALIRIDLQNINSLADWVNR